jgi:hypothetical protein
MDEFRIEEAMVLVLSSVNEMKEERSRRVLGGAGGGSSPDSSVCARPLGGDFSLALI